MNEMDPGSNMNPDLVSKSINFHGQLLQKTWEAEHGEGNLQKLGINNLDFGIYSQRQKHLSFQDRGKRLKLHQFISKRANVLFDTSLVEKEEPKTKTVEPGHYAVLPPFENFLNLDKTSRAQHFLQCLGVGEVVIGQIVSKSNSGLLLKILCLDGENARNINDLGIKGFCPTSNLISAVDKKGVNRSFLMNDLVACEVLEVMPDTEKIMCGMKGVHVTEEQKARLGLFHSDDFPEAYKLPQEGKSEPFEEMLEKSVGFHNPSNVSCLAHVMGLGNLHHTNIVSLKGRFPETEYATELRSVQAAKWAFRSVADGIEHFKAGRMTEAFQCLNKALSIDANNIEGLVARGALYANGGSFKKAIDDFEIALKMNPTHVNARKYMGETLVAYGRNHEDSGQMEDALKMYERCLEIVPYHEEALNSIEYIRVKMANGSTSLTDGLVPSLTSKTQGVKDTLKQLLGNEQATKEEVTGSAKKKKKEKKAKKHKRHSSSSSSSSSGSSSSSSSSTSSSDTSSASSNDSHRKKKHKSRKSEPKEKSLSPLSKRMAIMDSSAASETDGQRGSHYNPPALPYSFSTDPASAAAMVYTSAGKTDKESEYEQRVCKFLEQTKGDSDYEEKVRKFLDETAKWKKDRKAIEEKAKKKRKKEKKARSKSKKKKREERKKKKIIKEIEEKKLRDALRKQRRRSNLEEEDEFLYGEKDLRLSLPDLEDLQSKLSYYVKVEKGNSSKKKEKSSSVEKLVAAAQAKKANSPKGVLLLEEELREEARARKLAEKKKLDIFEDSPPQIRPPDAKNVPLPSGAPPPSSSKFKMQIGSTQNRLKKRGDKIEEKDTWDDGGEKRFIYMNETLTASKESEPKKLPEKKKEIEEQLAKAPMILDKLGGFRINPLNAEKKMDDSITPQKRKLRPRVSESDSSDSDAVAKKKDRAGRSPASSRSRSRSRSHKKYSSDSPPPKKYSSSSSRSPSYRKDRSRSKSGSYRSDRERERRRYRSSESGSYRSRSYSRSRSRSRSMDYHRRSRSRSDDRHRYHNKYPGRYPRNRGTYYRPRFQTGFKTRPGGFFPRGSFVPRGGPWRPGGRPFMPRMRGRGRPRFFHNNYKPRDDRYRRYERDMSRSDDDDGSPMRKVDAAKERIDRMLNEDKRHTGPLSEGEERDDDYIDRKDYERERPRPSTSPDMDRSKKDGNKEERKSGGKPNPW